MLVCSHVFSVISYASLVISEIRAVHEYVKDLKATLAAGTFFEQKSFLRSFIKKITVNHMDVKIEYTIPIQKKR
jgi:hypothetical protein